MSARAGLAARDPGAPLERGYALVVGPDGVVTSAGKLAPGDAVRLRFREDEADATVTAVRAKTT